ncbi:MAG: DUF58 domain-containing protein [Acidobacteriota bacterium]|nr:DUF58 domain-containing protein [Acidobacteriota bacterium]
MDLVLTLAGTFGLLLMGVVGLATLAVRVLFARTLARSLAETPGNLEGIEGRALATGLELPRRRWWLAAEPEWTLHRPPADVKIHKGRRTLREYARPADRGRGEGLRREYRVEDLFGLWRLKGRADSDGPWRVLPDLGGFDAARLESSLASGDLLSHPWGPARGDLVDARSYTRSDPARLILWKVYARSRELLVRAPETARSPERQPLIYLVAGDGDNPAAALMRLIIESGLFGAGVRFAADGRPTPVEDRAAAIEAVALSAAHRNRGGVDLAAALGHPLIGSDDPVVLVCPALEGGWTRPVIRHLEADPGRFFVFVAADVAPDPPPRTRWQRWMLLPDPPAGLPRPSWLAMARRLAGTGASCVAADRRSGELLALSGGHATLGRTA